MESKGDKHKAVFSHQHSGYIENIYLKDKGAQAKVIIDRAIEKSEYDQNL